MKCFLPNSTLLHVLLGLITFHLGLLNYFISVSVKKKTCKPHNGSKMKMEEVPPLSTRWRYGSISLQSVTAK